MIKLLFIVFSPNYSGISQVGKVTLGIYVIVPEIHLLAKRYVLRTPTPPSASTFAHIY